MESQKNCGANIKDKYREFRFTQEEIAILRNALVLYLKKLDNNFVNAETKMTKNKCFRNITIVKTLKERIEKKYDSSKR